jgi:hypothetical protein
MIPNRANYGGKTRRTSKIHWQKGRSTVTGHLSSARLDPEMARLLLVSLNMSHFQLLCPMTSKIPQRASLTCEEESVLATVGRHDVRFARF